MKIQDEKGREVCNQIVCENLSRNKSLRILKPYNHTGEANNIIIDNALARKEELGESNTEDVEHDHPTFAVMRRNNFCYRSFTASTMHLIFLGLVHAFISVIHQLSTLFDIKK